MELILQFCRDNYNTIHHETRNYVELGLEIAQKTKREKDKFVLKAYQAFYQLYTEERKKAELNSKAILPGLLKHQSYTEYGLAVIILSQIEWARGNHEKAYTIVYRALDQIKFKKNKGRALIRLHWILGGFSLDLGEIEDSYRNYSISNRLCKDETDLGMIAYVKIGLASTYLKKGKLSNAKNLFEEALNASQNNNLWLAESRAHYEIGMIHFIRNDLRKAEDHIHQSYLIREEHNSLPAMVSSLTALAEIDLENDQTESARKKLLRAHKICLEKNLRAKMVKILKLLSKIDESKGEYESALFLLKKHNQLEKEITKIEVDNKHQFLKLSYKAKKTEQDIYLERQSNRNLKNALDKEKELNDLKTRFVSITSHQFRTPMAIIQSNIDLVNMIIQNSESKQKVQFEKANKRIQKEIHNMVNLMDDILILGKINSGKSMSLKSVSTNLEEFCKNVIAGFNGIQKEQREMSFSCTGKTKEMKLDHNLLRHILSNLISNAFKYSDDNPSCKLLFENDQATISIVDNGIGIPEKDHPKLFEPFHRATNVGEINGTGLGLSIAKEYAELLHGSIAVQSEINKGTTVTLTLPVNS